MIRVCILCWVIFGALQARAQQASGESNDFTLTSDTAATAVLLAVEKPPIAFELNFSEPSGNGLLDAGETGLVEVTIHNRGKKEATLVSVSPFFVPDSTDLSQEQIPAIALIAPGDETKVLIHITAGALVSSRTVRVGVALKAANGLRCEPPAEIEFNTKGKE